MSTQPGGLFCQAPEHLPSRALQPKPGRVRMQDPANLQRHQRHPTATYLTYIFIYTHLETLSAFFFAGGKTLLGLRRKLSTDMLKQQNTEKIPTRNYAGIMGNYTAWKHDRLTISKQPANQNLRHGCKNAGKHLKAPFTRQSRLFPERQN